MDYETRHFVISKDIYSGATYEEGVFKSLEKAEKLRDHILRSNRRDNSFIEIKTKRISILSIEERAELLNPPKPVVQEQLRTQWMRDEESRYQYYPDLMDILAGYDLPVNGIMASLNEYGGIVLMDNTIPMDEFVAAVNETENYMATGEVLISYPESHNVIKITKL